MSEPFTKDEIKAIRAAIAEKPSDDMCDPDCEHIECGYVVACERHANVMTGLANTLIPRLLNELEALQDVGIPLELHCPKCGHRHVDQDEFATTPHRTHLCHACKHLWRPYPVATYGVDVHVACRFAVGELIGRRDELLTLVAKMTRETPYPAELDECRSARATLVAEIGTLRSRIAELEGRHR